MAPRGGLTDRLAAKLMLLVVSFLDWLQRRPTFCVRSFPPALCFSGAGWVSRRRAFRSCCGALRGVAGNESMVRCLLEEGANAASADSRGMTPIAHAAHGGHLLAVRALLKAKATGGTSR